MMRGTADKSLGALIILCAFLTGLADGQRVHHRSQEKGYGPVVRAYLDYLRNEQEVVDDRVSRREVSAAYFRRNSNRIRALRLTAVRIANESQNDYLPELEAVTRDEFGNLFESPPSPGGLRVGEVINDTFRFLGVVRTGELFYVFARLDPYEQAELSGKEEAQRGTNASGGSAMPVPAATHGAMTSRPRRANAP